MFEGMLEGVERDNAHRQEEGGCVMIPLLAIWAISDNTIDTLNSDLQLTPNFQIRLKPSWASEFFLILELLARLILFLLFILLFLN
jgi:hypothetical protein